MSFLSKWIKKRFDRPKFRTYTIQCRDTGFSGNTYKIRTLSTDVAIAKGFVSFDAIELLQTATKGGNIGQSKEALVSIVEMLEKSLKIGLVEPAPTDELLTFMPMMDRMFLYFCIVGLSDAAMI